MLEVSRFVPEIFAWSPATVKGIFWGGTLVLPPAKLSKPGVHVVFLRLPAPRFVGFLGVEIEKCID